MPSREVPVNRRAFLLVLLPIPAWARSSNTRKKFQSQNPCPSTGRKTGACPGYVVDHIHPLKRGGADHPDNMQWQTREEAREKDRWE